VKKIVFFYNFNKKIKNTKFLISVFISSEFCRKNVIRLLYSNILKRVIGNRISNIFFKTVILGYSNISNSDCYYGQSALAVQNCPLDHFMNFYA
jgi:hypothetical protein